jgi:hypothetical protein
MYFSKKENSVFTIAHVRVIVSSSPWLSEWIPGGREKSGGSVWLVGLFEGFLSDTKKPLFKGRLRRGERLQL